MGRRRKPGSSLVARASSSAPVRVAAADVPGKGVGLVVLEDVSAGDILLEESPLLQASTNLDEREKVAARLITQQARCEYEFCGESGVFQSDGELVIARLKVLAASEGDLQARLLAFARGPQPLVPADHPLSVATERALGMAARTLRLPGAWTLEELGHGLQVLATCAMQSSFVYELGCRANHACLPNTTWEISPEGVLQLRAVCTIPSGKEVTISYAPPVLLLHWQARRRFMWESWGFTCTCDFCRAEHAAEGLDGGINVAVGPGPTSRLLDSVHANNEQVEDEMEVRKVKSGSEEHPSATRSSVVDGSWLKLPRSHVRCLQCTPQDGEDRRLIDVDTYKQWLANSSAVPILRRVNVTSQGQETVSHRWQCTSCSLELDPTDQPGTELDKHMCTLVQAERYLANRAQEHFAAHDIESLEKLWPMSERMLGPWHGVTLFCISQLIPVSERDAAERLRNRLIAAGVNLQIIGMSCV